MKSDQELFEDVSRIDKRIDRMQDATKDAIGVLEKRIKELEARIFELEPEISTFDMECQTCGNRFNVNIKKHTELDTGNWGHECLCPVCGKVWNKIIEKRVIVK